MGVFLHLPNKAVELDWLQRFFKAWGLFSLFPKEIGLTRPASDIYGLLPESGRRILSPKMALETVFPATHSFPFVDLFSFPLRTCTSQPWTKCPNNGYIPGFFLFSVIPYFPSNDPALVQLLTLSTGKLMSWLPGFKSRPFVASQPGHTRSDFFFLPALLYRSKWRKGCTFTGNEPACGCFLVRTFLEAWSIVTTFLKDNW